MGWIVAGIIASLFILVISILTKYKVIEEIINFTWYPIPIITSILMGVGLFLLGFFGFTRLFWFLLSGEFVMISFRVLESGSEGSWSLILTIPY